jgi:hypothetical protein
MYEADLHQEDVLPWYKQMWPWFLITLPASAVFGGIATIIIAVHSPNALVVDDYYKAGLAINQDKQRFSTARAMQLTGLLRSDATTVSVALTATEPLTEKTLELQIIHATRSELDRTVLLQRDTDGNYRAPLPALPAGTWYLTLQDEKQTWEIRSRLSIDGPFQAYLTPAS